jgi:hypothetical protein
MPRFKKVVKKKKVTGKKRVLKDKDAPVQVVDLVDAKKKFYRIFCDPIDVRDEQDIAKELGVSPAQLVEWRIKPEFYEPAAAELNRASKGALVLLHKHMMKNALEHGSQRAIDTLLEMHGVTQGKGSRVNILNLASGATGQVGGGSDFIAKLTDEELDIEISRLLSDTSEADVKFFKSKVVPVQEEEVMDAEVVQFDCLDTKSR